MKNITATIRRDYPVTDRALDALAGCLKPCSFPRRHMLVEAGRSVRHAFFIERGLTRSFWIVDGEEITTSFSVEGAIVFSMDELYYGIPSEEYVQTLEPFEGYAIALTDLVRLFETDLEWANWARIIHQNEYRRLHRSHKDRLTLPARQRYEALLSQQPEACRRAPLGYIASYLGITPSTLSRLRKRIR